MSENRTAANRLNIAIAGLEEAIGILEGLAKDVSACEWLDDDVADKPTLLDKLRAALIDARHA